MKVIEKGNIAIKKDENETMQVICKHCGAKLEITPKDVNNRGMVIPSYCFECPECKEVTNIKLKNVTSNFKYWVLVNTEEF